MTGATELLARTADLVNVTSVSRKEDALATQVAAELSALHHLEVHRVGDNVVARTMLGRPQRLLLVGHLDTVPANGNEVARLDAHACHGLGATDMKGGLAVMLALAHHVVEPLIDVTYVFYAREEIAASESGLIELFATRPDLVQGDAAIVGEPTDGVLEAGCQGTLRLRVVLTGARAHTARPWMGRNALHRLGPLLVDIAAYEPRRPVLDGCEFHESLQAVLVDGGVAANVVPDRVELVLNHRFAPDRTPAQAEDFVRSVLAPHLDDGDEVCVLDMAPAAAPALTHPLLASLIERNSLQVRAKLGWTDVARFAEHGVPAVNLGPGDATIAHTADEFVTGENLAVTYRLLADFLTR
jgi:succinyl-diaminopimelate desuccinylase